MAAHAARPKTQPRTTCTCSHHEFLVLLIGGRLRLIIHLLAPLIWGRKSAFALILTKTITHFARLLSFGAICFCSICHYPGFCECGMVSWWAHGHVWRITSQYLLLRGAERSTHIEAAVHHVLCISVTLLAEHAACVLSKHRATNKNTSEKIMDDTEVSQKRILKLC
jgi:hypothetical protein